MFCLALLSTRFGSFHCNIGSLFRNGNTDGDSLGICARFLAVKISNDRISVALAPRYYRPMHSSPALPPRPAFLAGGFVLIIALVILTSASVDVWAANNDVIRSERTTLTIGRVSGNPRKHAGRLTAFGEYLAHRLEGYGPTGTDIVLDANPETILTRAMRGEIDVISETVFTASRLVNTGAMEIALLEWKRGVQRYRTALIVRKDSDIETLTDLRGRTLAFEDPGSTSGFFLPYLEIMDAGLEMSPMDKGDPRPELVRYVFSNSEVNVVGSVVRGRADVGAISETDLNDPEVMTERFKPQLRVFHLTRWVPRSVLLVRRSMDPALKSKLREVLLGMHEDDAGRRVLDRYFDVGRYAEVDAQSRLRLEQIRKAVQARHGS